MSDQKSEPIVIKKKTPRKYYDPNNTSAEDSDLPYEFTKTKASGTLKSEQLGIYNRTATSHDNDPPVIQTVSMLLSFSFCLIYWTYLREANDLDLALEMAETAPKEFKKPWNQQRDDYIDYLKNQIKVYESEGKDTKDLKKNLTHAIKMSDG